jgi:ESX secretion system ATPase EccB
MATRRDQFQSYQFVVRRVVSSFVLHETDPAQPPLRRMSGAAFGSVMVAVIVLAIAGVIGVLKPGNHGDWKKSGNVIVEKETGARYVWMADQATGKHFLYPITNFASAALLAGSTSTTYVPAKGLLHVPRGPRLGLLDAPDAVPPSNRLLGVPWTLCSLPAQTISGEEVPNTALVVGRKRTSGIAIGQGAMLVRDIERNTLHLVWHGHDYPIPDEAPVLEGLTLRGQPQVEVGTAWLSALPAGQPMVAPSAPGRGQHTSVLPGGATVGEVRVVQSGGGNQFYLVQSHAIEPITEVQAEITLADPTVREQVYDGNPPVAFPLSAAVAAAAPRSTPPALDPALDPPANKPPMADVNSDKSTVCASFSNAGLVPDVAVEAAVEGAELAPATEQRTQNGTVLANRVEVEPGWGAVVESMTSPTATSGSLFLVTDEGRRYGIATDDARTSLGYSGVTPVHMPAALVARIPAGDALDPQAAQQRQS